MCLKNSSWKCQNGESEKSIPFESSQAAILQKIVKDTFLISEDYPNQSKILITTKH